MHRRPLNGDSLMLADIKKFLLLNCLIMSPVTHFERISVAMFYKCKTVLLCVLTCFLSLFSSRTEHGFIIWNVIYGICEENVQETHTLYTKVLKNFITIF